MGRARTGTIKLHGDHYDARIQLPDGTRPWSICRLGTPTNARKNGLRVRGVPGRGELSPVAGRPCAQGRPAGSRARVIDLRIPEDINTLPGADRSRARHGGRRPH
jgi:hypothetical protein